MHPVLVFVEVAGKVEPLPVQGFALDREIICRIQRVNDDVHILRVEVRLFEPVGKPFHPVFGEEPVHADDHLPLEVVTHLMYDFVLKIDESGDQNAGQASLLMSVRSNVQAHISKEHIMGKYTIVQARALSEAVFEMWIHAPQVARHAKAGQFCIIHADGAGERVPLTISATKGDDIRIAFMAVGTTTKLLATLKTGDELRDVAGPLGMPSDIAEGSETVIIVGGGVGVACTPILAQAAKDAGNYVIGIIGARNRELLIFEDDMRAICDELYVTTDDGSYGIKGFASGPLKDLCESGRKIDKVWIIGPGMMMKVTSEVTRPFGIKTYVSLNPVMVDGTGMCGSCRVTVGGEMKFACVDGPEFDAHEVDWNDLMTRQRMYLSEEKQSMEYRDEHHVCRCRKVE